MSYETKHMLGTFVVHNATDVFSGEIQVCDCNFYHFIVETNTTKAHTENGERPYAEAKANAHLFAAAPDLLSALIESVESEDMKAAMQAEKGGGTYWYPN